MWRNGSGGFFRALAIVGAIQLAGCKSIDANTKMPAYAPPNPPALTSAVSAKLDVANITASVTEELADSRIPGAVVLVGQRDQILYRQAFGQRSVLPDAQPMRPDTIFDIASLTKVVATTTAVMQLVEQRKLQLNAPVARYWPQFAANGKAGITLQQLLTHTSGLKPDLDLNAAWKGEQEALAKVVTEKPKKLPGSQFIYSDINFIVLAEIVQRVSGQRFDQYCEQYIFAPLGMKDTRFLPPASWRARIAPNDVEKGELRWGEVQDPTAYRMGGVTGHAGVFSTADDLAKFAQMLLKGGTLNGVKVLDATSVARMTQAYALPGDVKRGLGWDIRSPYSVGLGDAFSVRSFGHTGYTGTMLWLDPAAGSYLIVLANPLHPKNAGNVKPLRRKLAALVGAALKPERVYTGIDVLEMENFKPLAGKRVALVTNQSGRDRAGRRTVDVLANASNVKLVKLFSPEHGLNADKEGKIDSTKDEKTKLPVLSLYGKSRRPSDEALKDIDSIVIDLQDVGVRFYTYASTMGYVMEEAAKKGVEVVVLDRPNPINAAAVQGPVLDASLQSFTGYFSTPVRHGMTMGELAEMFNGEKKIGAKLTVVEMRDYSRTAWFDDTGLDWVNPSPNLRNVEQVALYPGVAIVEGANVSVGRGTDSPFQVMGAPWINASELAAYLNKRNIDGVAFSPVNFTPAAEAYANKVCQGVRIRLVNRDVLDTPRLGIELASALRHLYPKKFELNRTVGMIGSREIVAAIDEQQSPSEIAARWQAQLDSFQKIRAKYLVY
ncbi:MAG TPA: exo-beta-N-acetylmuramidase NamZ domain-containing protein [Pseudomonadales bacterium]|nr:exo-beta-N-acetylmuramidase NamZ domain-containing protein [Pseudomonadales bacterium]